MPLDRIRRRLLGGAAALLPLPGVVRAASAEAPAERRPDADVIIVGYGAAGAAAAVEAARAGSDVLILEKQSASSHCSTTRLSSGIYQCPDREINLDVLAHYIASTYVAGGSLAYQSGTLAPELQHFAKVWAELAPETYDWLKGLDPDFRKASSALFTTPRFMSLWEEFRPHIQAQIATYARWRDFSKSTYLAPKRAKMNGEALYACLENGIKSLPNIRIVYESPATELLSASDEVVGVRVGIGGAARDYYASQAVILACGGFAYNSEMRASLLPSSGNRFWAVSSSPANTGDGIAMALKFGASLVSPSTYFDRFCALLPESLGGVRLGVPLECIGSPHTLLVDNFGERFINESDLQDAEQHYGFFQDLLEFDPATLSFPRAPAWLIFDEACRSAGPLATLGEGSTVFGLIKWDRENLEAVKNGWILSAQSIDELAQKIALHRDNGGRMSAETLLDTLKRFNASAKLGRDAAFDRDPASMAEVSEAPFYALPVSIDVPHMACGLKTDSARRVVTWENRVIKGLWAAGETAPVSRFVHDRGGHLSECLVFGRYVGRLAAAEPKRRLQ